MREMAAPPGGGSNPPPNQNRPTSRDHRSSRPASGSSGCLGVSTSSVHDRSQTKEQRNETFRIIKEMSDILNTGLDTNSLAFCLRLCEDGVNPVALAHILKDWKQQQQKKD